VQPGPPRNDIWNNKIRCAIILGMNNYRWNFYCGVINGGFYMFATAFFDPSTVLPVFMNNFTSSKTMIGLCAADSCRRVVSSQLASAVYTQGKPYKKPFYLTAAAIRVSSIFLLTAIVYALSKSHRALCSRDSWCCCQPSRWARGWQACPSWTWWPRQSRAPGETDFSGRGRSWGRIFSWRRVIIKFVLERYDFPDEYALLFMIATAASFIALFSFAMAREPASPTAEKRKNSRIS